MTALIASANPAPKKSIAKSKAPATILHFTHAERAIARRDRTEIQIKDETMILPAIQRWSHVQAGPASVACTRNRTSPGIHVICERRIPRTDAFPRTYSGRESGRQK